jgi:hypothetical protein
VPEPPPPPRHTVLLHEKTGAAAGSNDGGFYTGSDGVRRYVKFYADPAQAVGEHTANRLYRDLGLAAPRSELFRAADGRLAYASELLDVDGQLGAILPKLSATERKRLATRALDGFAADVLTANWDAAGLTLDNIVVGKDGTPTRIDNGSAFLTRARGDRKSTAALEGFEEWWRYFDAANPGYKQLTDAAGVARAHDLDLDRQVGAILSLRDRAGGWDAWLGDLDLPADDRRAMVELLERRTEQLRAKRDDHLIRRRMDALEVDRPFKNRKDAASWGNATLARARGTMSPAELNAVQRYTGSSFSSNRRLREGSPPSPDDQLRDAAIDRARLPVDLVLYRGIRDVEDIQRAIAIGAQSEGVVFCDPAFGSSAILPGPAASFAGEGRTSIMLRMYARAGTPGLWVGDVSQFASEIEVINPRKTRLRVLASEWQPERNRWLVDVEVLPTG